MKDRIGQRLLVRRRNLGLSQEEVARRANISLQQMGRIERGESDPKLKTVQDLAVALDTTVAYLSGETTDKTGPVQRMTGTNGM